MRSTATRSTARALLNLVRTLGYNSARSHQVREAITLVAIPMLNADGGAVPRRQNTMTWAEVTAMHPQLAPTPRAWYHSLGANGSTSTGDFNPDLDYEPSSADLPAAAAA